MYGTRSIAIAIDLRCEVTLATAEDAALAVCRAWRNRLLQDDFYYKWLCERLHAEHLLYVPTDSAYHRAGWRALFLALWKIMPACQWFEV